LNQYVLILECGAGKYGPDCGLICGECKDNLCDHETGQCLAGCNPGWKEDLCKTSKSVYRDWTKVFRQNGECKSDGWI
jgi:hypothetical protein